MTEIADSLSLMAACAVVVAMATAGLLGAVVAWVPISLTGGGK